MLGKSNNNTLWVAEKRPLSIGRLYICLLGCLQGCKDSCVLPAYEKSPASSGDIYLLYVAYRQRKGKIDEHITKRNR